MRKCDGVRVDNEKKRDRLSVHHEFMTRKSDEVRIHHKKERWGETLP